MIDEHAKRKQGKKDGKDYATGACMTGDEVLTPEQDKAPSKKHSAICQTALNPSHMLGTHPKNADGTVFFPISMPEKKLINNPSSMQSLHTLQVLAKKSRQPHPPYQQPQSSYVQTGTAILSQVSNRWVCRPPTHTQTLLRF